MSERPALAPPDDLRALRHPSCFACSEENPHGLGLRCEILPDGSVAGEWWPKPWMQGYTGRLHGGVVATLLDSAMTQCLLARDVEAVTATLDIRYRTPAPLEGPYRISASIDEHRRTIYRMSAELVCDGTTIATAKAQFVRQ